MSDDIHFQPLQDGPNLRYVMTKGPVERPFEHIQYIDTFTVDMNMLHNHINGGELDDLIVSNIKRVFSLVDEVVEGNFYITLERRLYAQSPTSSDFLLFAHLKEKSDLLKLKLSID